MTRTLYRRVAAAVVLASVVGVASVAIGQEKPKKDDAAGPTVVRMSRLQFVPEDVTIKRGQTVRWENKDDRDYLIVARDQSFKSDNLRPKETFEHTFKEAGTFEYYNVYRPRSTGTVTVTE